jgi:hypothetical protein
VVFLKQNFSSFLGEACKDQGFDADGGKGKVVARGSGVPKAKDCRGQKLKKR